MNDADFARQQSVSKDNRIAELESQVYKLKLLLELANALNTKEPHVVITKPTPPKAGWHESEPPMESEE